MAVPQEQSWATLDQATRDLFESTYPGQGQQQWEAQNAAAGGAVPAVPAPATPGTAYTTPPSAGANVNGVVAPPGSVVNGAGQVVPAPAAVSTPADQLTPGGGPPTVTIGGNVSAGIPGTPAVLDAAGRISGPGGPLGGATPPAAVAPPAQQANTGLPNNMPVDAFNALAQRMTWAADNAVNLSKATGYVMRPVFTGNTWSFERITDAAHPDGYRTTDAQLNDARIAELAANTAVALAAATGWIEDPTTHQRIQTPTALLQAAQAAQATAAAAASTAEAAFTSGARTELAKAQKAHEDALATFVAGAQTTLTNAQAAEAAALAHKAKIDAAYQRGVATGIYIDPDTGQQTTTLASKKNDADIAYLKAQTAYQSALSAAEIAKQTGTIVDPITGKVVTTIEAQKLDLERAKAIAAASGDPTKYYEAAQLANLMGASRGVAPRVPLAYMAAAGTAANLAGAAPAAVPSAAAIPAGSAASSVAGRGPGTVHIPGGESDTSGDSVVTPTFTVGPQGVIAAQNWQAGREAMGNVGQGIPAPVDTSQPGEGPNASPPSATTPPPGFTLSPEQVAYLQGRQLPQFANPDSVSGRADVTLTDLTQPGMSFTQTPAAYRALTGQGKAVLGSLNQALSGQSPEDWQQSVMRQLPAGRNQLVGAAYQF